MSGKKPTKQEWTHLYEELRKKDAASVDDKTYREIAKRLGLPETKGSSHESWEELRLAHRLSLKLSIDDWIATMERGETPATRLTPSEMQLLSGGNVLDNLVKLTTKISGTLGPVYDTASKTIMIEPKLKSDNEVSEKNSEKSNKASEPPEKNSKTFNRA